MPPENNLPAKVEADVEDSEAQMRVLEAQVEALQKALQAVRSECSEQAAKSEALAARLLELTRSMQAHGSSTLENQHIQWDSHFAHVDDFFIASCRR